MIAPRYIIGFTGHRNLPDHGHAIAALRGVIEQVQKKARARNGTVEIFSSLAFGSDLLIMEVARGLNVPLHLILPKPVNTPDEANALPKSEGLAGDFWKNGAFLEADWELAHRQIGEAERGVKGGTVRLVNGAQTSPECYYDTNVQIVDSSDLVVAVWNGKEAAGLGGTGDVVELARIRNLPLMIIDPETGACSVERLEGFAAEKDVGLSTLSQMGQHLTRHHPRLQKHSKSLVVFPVDVDEAEVLLRDTAKSMAKAFRSAQVRTIWGLGLASALAAVSAVIANANLPGNFAWLIAGFSLVEVVLVFRARLIQRSLGKKEIHEAWIRCRFAAEIMRGQREAGRLMDPLIPLIARHHPEWGRFALTTALGLYPKGDPTETWKQQRDNYVQLRLQRQIDYFTDKQVGASKILKRANGLSGFLGNAAAAFVLGALVFKVLKASNLVPVHVAQSMITVISFTLLPIVLPLAVSLAVSLRRTLDASRRAVRYEEIALRLKEASVLIQSLKTASSVRRAVATAEEILIDELNEWHLFERSDKEK